MTPLTPFTYEKMKFCSNTAQVAGPGVGSTAHTLRNASDALNRSGAASALAQAPERNLFLRKTIRLLMLHKHGADIHNIRARPLVQ